MTTILKRRGCLTVPRLTLMSLIKMMLVMVSVAAISKTFGLLRFLLRLSFRSEERFSRNAETDLVCRLLLEKKKHDDRLKKWGIRCERRSACCYQVSTLRTLLTSILHYFSYCSGHHQDLHSFPTRRSSDLLTVPRLTLMSLIKMMLVMVSVAAISKTFGLLRFLLRLSF